MGVLGVGDRDRLRLRGVSACGCGCAVGGRRVRCMRGTATPVVSAVMVVRNEEAAVAAEAAEPPGARLSAGEAGSRGRLRWFELMAPTSLLAAFAGNDARVRTLLKAESRGKAAGLNDAIGMAHGEVLLFTDARQPIEPQALRLLIENFADPEVGAASGELMLGDPARGETGKGMGLYWRMEKKIRELESASGSVAGATGAIYCARRDCSLEPLPEGTILDDVLLPMQVVRRGSRVIFDPRARAWDSPDLGQSREFSRKVRTLSGNYQLLQLAPWLLGASNADSVRVLSAISCATGGALCAAGAARRHRFSDGALLSRRAFCAAGVLCPEPGRDRWRENLARSRALPIPLAPLWC